MKTPELVEQLTELVSVYKQSIESNKNRDIVYTLEIHHYLIAEAVRTIRELQRRLVKQTQAFEQFEARLANKWPLMKDDSKDPGAAL